MSVSWGISLRMPDTRAFRAMSSPPSRYCSARTKWLSGFEGGELPEPRGEGGAVAARAGGDREHLVRLEIERREACGAGGVLLGATEVALPELQSRQPVPRGCPERG